MIHNLKEVEESIKSKVISLDNKENKLLEIRNDFDETKKNFINHSDLVSSQRLKRCEELDLKVNSEFLDLKLETAIFKTFTEKIEYTVKGQIRLHLRFKQMKI